MEKNFDRSFEVVYSKIYDSCKQRLQEVKMSNNKFLLGLGIIFIIICLLVYIIRDTRIYVGITIFMSLAIFLGFMISGNIRYRKEYKQHVIEGLVKGYNERFYFDPKMGVPRMEYVISNFDRNFNEFYSEDRIYGRFEDGSNFQMSEVVTHYVQTYTDSEKGTDHSACKAILFWSQTWDQDGGYGAFAGLLCAGKKPHIL